MAQENKLDFEQFYMTRNEIASKHNSRLELQAMARVRDNMIKAQKEEREKTAKAEKTQQTSGKNKKQKGVK